MKTLLCRAALVAATLTLTVSVLRPAAAMAGTFPGDHWDVVVDPAQAGFDPPALAAAESLCAGAHVGALFVVRAGRAVAIFGAPERRFRMASARKSMMHAVIGVHLAEGSMDLGRTLGQMRIDDIQPLTEAEKKATLLDVTSARSGVYLPAAFETRGNAERRPERGSHEPGTFFYYNNWDFNVLSTIVEKETGEAFFDTFASRIAGPLAFEDFDASHLFMRYEPDKSEHGAYLMRMSARDLARVGVLYLNDGVWRGRQIVARDWVRGAGERVSQMTGGFAGRGYYGHLWWSQDIAGENVYYASGANGQRMFVVPSHDLVVVVLFDTYGQGGGHHGDTVDIAAAVIAAVSGKPSLSPATRTYAAGASRRPDVKALGEDTRGYVTGTYKHPRLGDVDIVAVGDAYAVNTGIGTFRLFPTGGNTGWIEDIECGVVFSDDANSDDRRLHVAFDALGRMETLRLTW